LFVATGYAAQGNWKGVPVRLKKVELVSRSFATANGLCNLIATRLAHQLSDKRHAAPRKSKARSWHKFSITVNGLKATGLPAHNSRKGTLLHVSKGKIVSQIEVSAVANNRWDLGSLKGTNKSKQEKSTLECKHNLCQIQVVKPFQREISCCARALSESHSKKMR
jgi:hypothetical protein